MQPKTIVCVNVTHKYISASHRKNIKGGHSNPIQNALLDILDINYDCVFDNTKLLVFHMKEANVEYGEDFITVEKSKHIQVIKLPNIAKSNLIKLSQGRPIKPFSFEIEIKTEFLKNNLDALTKV